MPVRLRLAHHACGTEDHCRLVISKSQNIIIGAEGAERDTGHGHGEEPSPDDMRIRHYITRERAHHTLTQRRAGSRKV